MTELQENLRANIRKEMDAKFGVQPRPRSPIAGGIVTTRVFHLLSGEKIRSGNVGAGQAWELYSELSYYERHLIYTCKIKEIAM